MTKRVKHGCKAKAKPKRAVKHPCKTCGYWTRDTDTDRDGVCYCAVKGPYAGMVTSAGHTCTHHLSIEE
jgi:hypothetical protein